MSHQIRFQWIKNKDKILKAFEGGDSHSQRKQRASNHDDLDKAPLQVVY